MSTPSTILNIQSNLESTTGTIAADTRNETMFGATRDSLDQSLADSQKSLLLAALAPLAQQTPSIEWNPFDAPPNTTPASAFLTVALADDGSPTLRVLSCPRSVASSNTSVIGLSGAASFTRTTDPLPSTAFLSGDVELTKSTYSRPISKLISARVHLTTTLKSALATYLGDDTFIAIKNVLPFRTDSTQTFSSPTRQRSQRSSTNVAVPLCWPLPLYHTVTIADDIPLPADAAALATALTSFNCRDHTWLTSNPLLGAWLAAVHLDAPSFAPSSDMFFSLNEAPTLTEYQVCVSVCRSIVADNLLARNIPELSVAILADPLVLTADTFPPQVIDTTTCPTSFNNPLPWIPSFPFSTVAPQVPNPSIPKTLTTATPSVASTVSTSSLTSSSNSRRNNPSIARWMAFLACEKPSNPSHTPTVFPPPKVTFTYSLSDPTSQPPVDVLILSPLHETFESLLRSKNCSEACSAMAHRFELSRSSAVPNIVTDYLLHCGPILGPFFQHPIWDLILSGNLCAAPLSPTPFQGFSPLSTLLLDNSMASSSSSIHPKLPSSGFQSFREVLRFINGCKWFIMTIGHPKFYEYSLVFRALCYLESNMVQKNLAARWQEPTIRTAPAMYQLLELIHNLFSVLSATASNMPQSNLIPIHISSPHHNTSFVVAPKIQDATLTIDLRASLEQWKLSCNAVITELCGSSSSLASLLQASQPVQISHYLFQSSSKKRPLPASDKDGTPPDREKKRVKKPQAEKNKEVLHPAGNYTIKDLLQLKSEGKIAAPRLPKMKGIQNKNGAALCFEFLLGCHCDSPTPCGYHLQANDSDYLPGRSNSDWKPFHEWMAAHSSYFKLSPTAAANSKLASA